MNKQEQIKDLYFNKKYNQVKIAQILNVSKQYVSKILLNDSDYKREKENRKELNRKKHKQKTIDYIKGIRKKKDTDIEYERLKQSHIQASQELSGGRKNISNKAYRDCNSSVYKYNSKTKSYHLIKEITAGFDAPKRVNWKLY